MTIKQQGGVFGRNPTFNNVDVDGAFSASDVDVTGGSINNTDIGTTTAAAIKGTTGRFSGVLSVGTDTPSGDFQVVDNSSNCVAYFTSASGSITLIGLGDVDDLDNGAIWYSNADNSMRFYTNAQEQVRFKSSGDLDLKTGNLIVSSGQGIDFSATSGTGTSELFDDYEEGTWTPTPTQSAFVNPTGSYIKMGKLVVATFELTGFTTTFGNFLQISGLPYAPVASSQNSGSLGFIDNGVTDYIFRVNSATSGIDVYNSSGSIYRYSSISDDRIAGAVTYITS